MTEIIKLLEETDKIYSTKLTDLIDILKNTDVKDDIFDKLLDRVSSLISLKLQKEHFINDYKANQINKEEK